MPSYQKLMNGLTDLGLHKMQEHLDYYIKAVNSGEKSFSDALEELIEIEKANNQLRAINACVKTANFPFLKTVDDFDFSFQPGINRKEILEFTSLGFIERTEKFRTCNKTNRRYKQHRADILHRFQYALHTTAPKGDIRFTKRKRKS